MKEGKKPNRVRLQGGGPWVDAKTIEMIDELRKETLISSMGRLIDAMTLFAHKTRDRFIKDNIKD